MLFEGSLACRTMRWWIMRRRSRAASRIATLDFRRASFDLFQDLLGVVLCVSALGGRRDQETQLIFKHPYSKLRIGASL